MLDQEIGSVQFFVALQRTEAKRIGFNDDMTRLFGEQFVGYTGNDPQACAYLKHVVLRPNPALDQIALFSLVIPLPKAGAISSCRQVLGNFENAALRPKSAAHGVKEQPL